MRAVEKVAAISIRTTSESVGKLFFLSLSVLPLSPSRSLMNAITNAEEKSVSYVEPYLTRVVVEIIRKTHSKAKVIFENYNYVA